MIIYGINPTAEALSAQTASNVWVGGRRDARIRGLVALAERVGVPVQYVEIEELDRRAGGARHQGVVARVRRPTDYGASDLVRGATGMPLILVLDGIEDPQNFGALVRTADAAGVDGVVFQTRRAAQRTATAVKASAGAMTYARLAPVVNISRAIAELKDAGVWVVGLDANAERPYHDVELCQPTGLVVGAEGKGLRRLVRESCDLTASIPMLGRVSSLNVSVSAGIVLYEAIRQRNEEFRQRGPRS